MRELWGCRGGSKALEEWGYQVGVKVYFTGALSKWRGNSAPCAPLARGDSFYLRDKAFALPYSGLHVFSSLIRPNSSGQ